MKKTILISIAILAICSCRKASELPPIDDSYATTFILPDPADLSAEERAFIKEQEAEYKNSL